MTWRSQSDLPNQNYIRIDNEAFGLSFPTDQINIEAGHSMDVSGGVINAAGSGSSNYCASSSSCPFEMVCYGPSLSGTTVTYSPGSGYIPYSGDYYELTAASNAQQGSGYGSCVVTLTATSPNEVVNWIFYVDVS
jgi:hypothetical protein